MKLNRIFKDVLKIHKKQPPRNIIMMPIEGDRYMIVLKGFIAFILDASEMIFNCDHFESFDPERALKGLEKEMPVEWSDEMFYSCIDETLIKYRSKDRPDGSHVNISLLNRYFHLRRCRFTTSDGKIYIYEFSGQRNGKAVFKLRGIIMEAVPQKSSSWNNHKTWDNEEMIK